MTSAETKAEFEAKYNMARNIQGAVQAWLDARLLFRKEGRGPATIGEDAVLEDPRQVDAAERVYREVMRRPDFSIMTARDVDNILRALTCVMWMSPSDEVVALREKVKALDDLVSLGKMFHAVRVAHSDSPTEPWLVLVGARPSEGGKSAATIEAALHSAADYGKSLVASQIAEHERQIECLRALLTADSA